MFDKSWEQIHSERKWGHYPKEELVRWGCQLEKATTRNILDLGSGQGASTWFLAREGFNPVAVDGSFSALQKGCDRLNREGLPYLGTACDLNQLPFMADSFDAVIDVVASAHNTYSGMKAIFGEVARVLKPKGQLFSVLPTNRCSRRTFKGLVTTFLEEWEVNPLLLPHFANIKILQSSYQLDTNCRIDSWIVTSTRKE